MAGLILGINVTPSATWKAAARSHPEHLRLLIQEGKALHKAKRALGFVLDRGGVAPDSVQVPGPVLTLTRGRPTDITVVNRLKESGAVHWHGIELESYSDGVAGLSGMDAAHVAHAIAASDSFTAHLTLPRAGTFIYHTHLNDIEQLSSGLYGAIIVLEPGQRLDPAIDHVFVTGWDGPGNDAFLVNGDTTGSVTWRAGADHRLRLVNIGAAGEMTFVVRKDTVTQAWRALAMDGADLPAGLRVSGPARARVDVGETRDFVWHPAPGTYRLSMHRGPKQRLIYSQVIVVQ